MHLLPYMSKGVKVLVHHSSKWVLCKGFSSSRQH